MSIKEVECQNNWRRVTNKEVIGEMGKNKFGYNFNEEITRYKFMRGIKIERRQWRKLKKNGFCNMPVTYKQWEESIREKYKSYSRDKLEEFENYLQFLINDSATSKEMNTIIATSITSSVMSAVFSAIIAQKMDETGNAIWLFLAILIGAFALAALVVYVILNSYSLIRYDSIKNKMVMDYCTVIDSMLKD